MKVITLLAAAISVSIAMPVMRQSRENARPNEPAVTTGTSSGGSSIPADQRPTETQNATPNCGIAAETDAQRNGRLPCNPGNVTGAPKR
jgi:hypothetical protein